MSRWRWIFALLLLGGGAGAQQPVIRFADRGFGPGPALLATLLANPYDLIEPGVSEALLAKDRVYPRSVIVLGRSAVVEGTVNGDVVVIGGDLHVHPRATIHGRAIAFGGAVYQSALVNSVGAVVDFRDFTYEIVKVSGGYELRYVSFRDRPEAAVTWPGLYGLRGPAYDRANGLSLIGGPLIAVPNTGLRVEPRIAYRSQLGEFDPALDLSYAPTSQTIFRLSGARDTYSNEGWIWPDPMNSLGTLLIGHDTRNHWRAWRVQGTAARVWRWAGAELEPYLGARWERDRSVRPDSFALGGPWSFHGRESFDDMLRPNPPIDSGVIVSGLGGVRLAAIGGGVTSRAEVNLEGGQLSPTIGGSRGFMQATFDGSITFPTFGIQTLRVDGHALVSFAGDTPLQRWGYVGGSGSIPTIDLLERGGNQLVYVDARYNIPLSIITLPFIGPPVLTIREVLGGADHDRFPALAQATGLRLSASLAYLEFLVDPARRTSHVGIGLTAAR